MKNFFDTIKMWAALIWAGITNKMS